MTSPLEPHEIENRNTYFGAEVDEHDRIVLIHKIVYGAVDLEHKYSYHGNGELRKVEIIDANDSDEETRVLSFDGNGIPSSD